MKALLFTLGLASLHALSAHAGVDPACAPVIKSSLARAAAPAWEAVTVVSPGNFKMEAIQFGGQSFMRMNGERWKKAPMDLAKGEQQVVAQRSYSFRSLTNSLRSWVPDPHPPNQKHLEPNEHEHPHNNWRISALHRSIDHYSSV